MVCLIHVIILIFCFCFFVTRRLRPPLQIRAGSRLTMSFRYETSLDASSVRWVFSPPSSGSNKAPHTPAHRLPLRAGTAWPRVGVHRNSQESSPSPAMGRRQPFDPQSGPSPPGSLRPRARPGPGPDPPAPNPLCRGRSRVAGGRRSHCCLPAGSSCRSPASAGRVQPGQAASGSGASESEAQALAQVTLGVGGRVSLAEDSTPLPTESSLQPSQLPTPSQTPSQLPGVGRCRGPVARAGGAAQPAPQKAAGPARSESGTRLDQAGCPGGLGWGGENGRFRAPA